jgi:hypothetical protein
MPKTHPSSLGPTSRGEGEGEGGAVAPGLTAPSVPAAGSRRFESGPKARTITQDEQDRLAARPPRRSEES